MDTELETSFRRMGARVRFIHTPDWQTGVRLRGPQRPTAGESAREALDTLRVDVRRDHSGEYFDVRCDPRVRVEAADVQPADRHLLLVARVAGETSEPSPWSTFLCGHDEKAWFVAAIPESAAASDVQAAKDALKPAAVWEAMQEYGVPRERRDARKTAAFVRQGEWFFIPRPQLKVHWRNLLRNEPIQRGAGKPHVCQFLRRTDGERVYVSDQYPNGLTDKEYWDLPSSERTPRYLWRRMVRNATVYAKGNIRHPDHKTVFLSFWHEVVPNTESEAHAMQFVAFLD